MQLIINDYRLEGVDLHFPITKSFESLTDPTKIITDYCKEITVPATSRNQAAFGVPNSVMSIPSPTATWDAVVMSDDGRILFKGYAKFNEAVLENNIWSYKISVYGDLGDIFKKLSKVKPAELPDLAKSNPRISAGVVLTSFEKDTNVPLEGGVTPTTTDWFNIYGFAPSYRGVYEEGFDPVTIQRGNEFIPLNQFIADKMTDQLKAKGVKDTDIATVLDKVGVDAQFAEGKPDWFMDQYLFTKVRPYIYINRLLASFMQKAKEISGYSIILDDDDFFNINNPYWSHMVYGLDFPEGKSKYDLKPINTSIDKGWVGSYYEWLPSTENESKTISLAPFTISNIYFAETSPRVAVDMYLKKESYIVVDAYIEKDQELGVSKKYWIAREDFPFKSPEPGLNDNNRLPYSVEFNRDKSNPSVVYSINIPSIVLDVPSPDRPEALLFNIVTQTRSKSTTVTTPLSFETWNHEVIDVQWNKSNKVTSGELSIGTSVEALDVSWKSLWKSDRSMFDVVLEWTKMCGLVWSIDYGKQVIKLMRRDKYFQNPVIEDWTDKIVLDKPFIIKPLVADSFGSFTFGYKDLQGFPYSQYKNIYNSTPGSLKIDFNTGGPDNKFEKSHPSISGTKYACPFYRWNEAIFVVSAGKVVTYPDLSPQPLPVNIMFAEDDNQKAAVSSSNWWFRGMNIPYDPGYIILSPTPQMIARPDHNSCWIDLETHPEVDNFVSYSFPMLVTATKMGELCYDYANVSFGSTFTIPKLDYTYDNSTTNAKHYYMYDLFWNRFMKGRFRNEMKSVTTYISLDEPWFTEFSFNKFIRIQDQLWMVNKIFDFDPGNPDGMTKVELVQVDAIDDYASSQFGFSPIMISTKNIELEPSGSTSIIAKSSSPVKSARYIGTGGPLLVKVYPTDPNTLRTPIRITASSNKGSGVLEITTVTGKVRDFDLYIR